MKTRRDNEGERRKIYFQNIISRRINLLGVLSFSCWCWLLKLRGITTNLLNNVSSQCLPMTATVSPSFSSSFTPSDEVFASARWIWDFKSLSLDHWLSLISPLYKKQRTRRMFNFCVFASQLDMSQQNRRILLHVITLWYTPTLNCTFSFSTETLFGVFG